MRVKTEAHGVVDVLFHVFIDSKSALKCGNSEFYVGAFTTFDKAMEAANSIAKERGLNHWIQDGDNWAPMTSYIATETRKYKTVHNLRIAVAILDSRRSWHGSKGWNWFWINPSVLDMLDKDMSNMDAPDLVPQKKQIPVPKEGIDREVMPNYVFWAFFWLILCSILAGWWFYL